MQHTLQATINAEEENFNADTNHMHKVEKEEAFNI
jgi:hypothetical protein